MMRYQRVSPDYLPPLTNGITKKPYLTPSPSHQDTTTSIAGRGSYTTTSSKGFGFRSTQQQDPPSPLRRGGDVLLQWGQRQRKRSRNSRTEIRSTTDDSSSSSGQGLVQSSNKRQRRFVNPCMPPPTPSAFSVRNSTNPRNGFVAGKELRNLEDRLTNGSTPSRTNNNNNNNNRMISRSATVSKRSPPSPDQTEKRSSLRDQNNHQRQNGFDQQRVNRSETNLEMDGEREKATTQVEVVEWPRIYIALSRKEKEEDFLVMKGTKLPHRPRKRAKNIDKALQYCFPGMWLSDLTKNRYEVREKKNVKKQQKRRGLKGLENLDSDSE